MPKKKATDIMISHEINEIETMCDWALWLEQSRFKIVGNTKEVCEKYAQFIRPSNFLS